MKILIVCVSGLTSNVLSRRLNQYAAGNNEQLHFVSLSYRDLKDEIGKADLVLITPQGKTFFDTITSVCEEYGIPYDFIEETDKSFMDVETIYKLTKNHINETDKVVDTQNDVPITITGIVTIIRNSFKMLLFVIAAIPVLYLLDMVIDSSLLEISMLLTRDLFGMSYMLAFGYAFSEYFGLNKNTGALLNLSCLLVLIIQRKPAAADDMNPAGIAGYIDISNLGVFSIAYLIPLSILGMSLYAYSYRHNVNLRFLNIKDYQLLYNIVPMFLVISVFLLVRVFLSFL